MLIDCILVSLAVKQASLLWTYFFLFIKIKNKDSMENYKEGKSKETIKRNLTSSGNFGYMLMNIFLGNQIIII